MTNTHKVKMKVGDVEFEAEGTPAEQEQCARFLAAMSGQRAAAPAPTPAVKPKAASEPAQNPEPLSKRLLKRFFTEGVGDN